MESEPKGFTVIQGSKIGSATLPYSYGIEIKSQGNNRIVFSEVSGLEKNKSLPAVGTKNGLKTQKQIRPGMESDFIKIPLYQGGYGADGTRAIYNEHVYDIIISGVDLPALLPENSDVDLTINIDKSQKVSIQAYFPYLDHTAEIEVPTDTVQSSKANWLANEIRKAKGSIQELKEEGSNSEKVQKIEKELKNIENAFEKDKEDGGVLNDLRKTLKTIDELSETTEWPKLEEELKEEFYRLEKANKDLGNDRSTQIVTQLRNQLEEVLKSQDIKLGKALVEEIHSVFFQLTMVYQLIGFIRHHNQNFSSYHWADSHRARQLLNEGLQQIGENPNVEGLHPIVIGLINLLPNDERPSGDDSVLVGKTPP